MVKVKILEGSEYTFEDKINGRIFEAEQVTDDLFKVFISQVFSGYSDKYWHFSAKDVRVIEEDMSDSRHKKKSNKVKQKPPKLQQTKVIYCYADGSTYVATRVTGAIIDTRNNSVGVFNKVLRNGTEIKQEVHVSFKDLIALFIISPKENYDYEFDKGRLIARTVGYNKIYTPAPFQH